jgi:hypothetical protein
VQARVLGLEDIHTMPIREAFEIFLAFGSAGIVLRELRIGVPGERVDMRRNIIRNTRVSVLKPEVSDSISGKQRVSKALPSPP